MAARKSPARKKPARKSAPRKAPAARRGILARKGKPATRGRGAGLAPLATCLWFNGQAEEAANYYVSIFPKSRITQVTRTPGVGQETHKRPPGSVLCVGFELNGEPFLALNGGPQFNFNQAVSIMVPCSTQEEIDYYWEKLRAGGDPGAEACGWLKDRYGLSWQVYWKDMLPMWKDPERPGTVRAFAAMMDMTKIDISALRKAFKG